MMAKQPNWTPAEDSILRQHYSDKFNEEISVMLPGRTGIAVMKRAHRLGLRKGPTFHKRRAERQSRLQIGNRHYTSTGYVIVYVPDHPYASGRGYVMEHRLVMEKHIGRHLLPHEVVHHKNEIKDDNRVENLELMTHGEHTRLHHIGSTRPKSTRKRIAAAARRRYAERPESHNSYTHIPKRELKDVLLETLSPTRAAEHFGVTRRTIYNKLDFFGIRGWYDDVKSHNHDRKAG